MVRASRTRWTLSWLGGFSCLALLLRLPSLLSRRPVKKADVTLFYARGACRTGANVLGVTASRDKSCTKAAHTTVHESVPTANELRPCCVTVRVSWRVWAWGAHSRAESRASVARRTRARHETRETRYQTRETTRAHATPLSRTSLRGAGEGLRGICGSQALRAYTHFLLCSLLSEPCARTYRE